VVWSGGFPLTAEVIVVDPLRPSLNYTDCVADSGGSALAYLSLAYYILLLAIMCVMAFRIRNAYADFNEAKPMVMSVYSLTFGSIIIIAIQLSGVGDRTSLYLIRSVGTIVIFFSLMAIMFTPKLLRIFNPGVDDGGSFADSVARHSQKSSRSHAGENDMELVRRAKAAEALVDTIGKNASSLTALLQHVGSTPRDLEQYLQQDDALQRHHQTVASVLSELQSMSSQCQQALERREEKKVRLNAAPAGPSKPAAVLSTISASDRSQHDISRHES